MSENPYEAPQVLNSSKATQTRIATRMFAISFACITAVAITPFCAFLLLPERWGMVLNTPINIGAVVVVCISCIANAASLAYGNRELRMPNVALAIINGGFVLKIVTYLLTRS